MRSEAASAAERAARESYGRLLAVIARDWRDIAAAEDALADAFARALEHWPEAGVPANPDGWLVAAARRRLIDGSRAAAVRLAAAPDLALSGGEEAEMTTLPDRRLELMFVCAHPSIDDAARTPLMLQTVLGLDAVRIAGAFLVPPATMSQRLVRAKARIRDGGLRFAVPDADELPARADAVREAIYGAYGTGWDDLTGTDPRRRGLAEEAIWLARVLVSAMPEDAEARGLLALILHCEARRTARRTTDGAYVPLSEQDVSLWDRRMVAEAESQLRAAGKLGRIGRFQLEAAIQSAHAERRMLGSPPASVIAELYDGLAALAPTAGVLVGRAAAIGEADGPEAGLAALDALPAERMRNYQPHWATRAHLLARAGRTAEAAAAFARAAGLTDDPAVRAHLLGRASDGE